MANKKKYYPTGGILPPGASDNGVAMTHIADKAAAQYREDAKRAELDDQSGLFGDMLKFTGSTITNGVTGIIGLNNVWDPSYDSGTFQENEENINMGSKIASGVLSAAGIAAGTALTAGALGPVAASAVPAVSSGITSATAQDDLTNSGVGLIPGIGDIAGKAYGGKLYADGGNLTEFNSGGTHEMNPNGGIDLGGRGVVEEGETRWQDFIFSDRILVDPTHLSEFALDQKLSGQTYADASKYIKKKLNPHNKEFDAVTDKALERMLNRLADAQESYKLKQFNQLNTVMSDYSNMMAGGGFMTEAGTDMSELEAVIQAKESNLLGYDDFWGSNAKDDPRYLATPKPLTKMTLDEVLEWQEDNFYDFTDEEKARQMKQHGRSWESSSRALGKYQFVNTTLKNLIEKEGNFDKSQLFDADMQDYLGEKLMNQIGLKDWETGKKSDRDFAKDISKTWEGVDSDEALKALKAIKSTPRQDTPPTREDIKIGKMEPKTVDPYVKKAYEEQGIQYANGGTMLAPGGYMDNPYTDYLNQFIPESLNPNQAIPYSPGITPDVAALINTSVPDNYITPDGTSILDDPTLANYNHSTSVPVEGTKSRRSASATPGVNTTNPLGWKSGELATSPGVPTEEWSIESSGIKPKSRMDKKALGMGLLTGVSMLGPTIGNIMAMNKLSKPTATPESQYDSDFIDAPTSMVPEFLSDQESLNRITNEASGMRTAIDRTAGGSRSARMAGNISSFGTEAEAKGRIETQTRNANAQLANRAKELNLANTLKVATTNANIDAQNKSRRMNVKNMNDADAQAYESQIAALLQSIGMNAGNTSLDLAKILSNPTQYGLSGNYKGAKKTKKE